MCFLIFIIKYPFPSINPVNQWKSYISRRATSGLGVAIILGNAFSNLCEKPKFKLALGWVFLQNPH